MHLVVQTQYLYNRTALFLVSANRPKPDSRERGQQEDITQGIQTDDEPDAQEESDESDE